MNGITITKMLKHRFDCKTLLASLNDSRVKPIVERPIRINFPTLKRMVKNYFFCLKEIIIFLVFLKILIAFFSITVMGIRRYG